MTVNDGTDDSAAATATIHVSQPPVLATVYEEGPSQTTGYLAATNVNPADTLTWTIVGGSTPNSDHSYDFRIDNFRVNKNGGNILDDPFADGLPPPASPPFGTSGTTEAYNTTGTFTEAGGFAGMAGADAGALNGLTDSDPKVGHFATLGTNTDPTNLSQGLKSNASFAVIGTFDLVLPDENRQDYGIRLSDRILNGPQAQPGNDIVELVVIQGRSGNDIVQLRQLDFTTGTSTNLQSFALDPAVGDNRIRLFLTYDPETPGTVVAGYQLLPENAGIITTTGDDAAISVQNNTQYSFNISVDGRSSQFVGYVSNSDASFL